MNAENINITTAGVGDLDAWLRLRKLLWDDASDEDHLAEIHEVLSDPDSQLVLIAVDGDGTCVGFLEASIRPFVEDCYSDSVGYLEGWFVDPSFRKIGIGRKLVQSAETWARSRGCSEMASDAEIGNEVGIHAHLGLGYGETSRLIHFRKLLS